VSIENEYVAASAANDNTHPQGEFVNSAGYALICDDHPLVGRGLRELLKEHPMLASIGCTISEKECLRYITDHGAPSIVIVDFWLTNEASEDLVQTLGKDWPEIPILMMSSDDDPVVQRKCQQWGAKGFINKQASPGVIREAVSALIQGLGWFMPLDDQAILLSIRKNQWPITARELGLTIRQGQILAMILDGLPNKRIAQNLNVTEATVKEHVTGLLQKLKVKSRVEAIAQLKDRCFKAW
jgi:DNA-binding NarL/FixJ family response regulator